MKRIACLVFASLAAFALDLRGAELSWNQWPARASDIEPSIRVPSNFTSIKPKGPQSDKTILNGRFRSPNGSVEFAITANYARPMARSVEARAIKLPLLPGERVTDRKPTTRKVKSEDGDYQLFDEDITVEGPKGAYTRHFRIELSTSSLPGASSVLWEFKVADEKARKTYQAVYRKFKESLNLGED